MDYATCRSLPAMFFDRARERAAAPFLWVKRDKQYRSTGWTETADAVSRLARGLAGLGIERGDRVVLVSENRPEWVIADLAIMTAGGITVPAYVTNTVEDHRHILGNSGARAAIVSSPALASRVVAAAEQVPSVHTMIAIDPGAEASSRLAVRGWDEVLALGAAQPDDVAERVAALAPDDTACIIYTSGTGGVPKGVLLSHRNILANCRGALSPARTARAWRRGVPELSAIVAFVRAHGGDDVPDLDRGAALLRRGRRDLGGQPDRSAADADDSGAAALRDDAPAHQPRHRARARGEAAALRQGGGGRAQAPGR